MTVTAAAAAAAGLDLFASERQYSGFSCPSEQVSKWTPNILCGRSFSELSKNAGPSRLKSEICVSNKNMRQEYGWECMVDQESLLERGWMDLAVLENKYSIHFLLYFCFFCFRHPVGHCARMELAWLTLNLCVTLLLLLMSLSCCPRKSLSRCGMWIKTYLESRATAGGGCKL